MKIDWIEPNAVAASGVPVGKKDLLSLYEQGIRAIITLTEHPITTQTEITPQILDEMGLTYLHTPIIDQHPPSIETVGKVTQFIDQMKARGQPVLIHCQAGVGRTGTMLHAYYLAEGLTLDEAKTQVRSTRPTSQFLMLSDSQKAFLQTFAERSQSDPLSADVEN